MRNAKIEMNREDSLESIAEYFRNPEMKSFVVATSTVAISLIAAFAMGWMWELIGLMRGFGAESGILIKNVYGLTPDYHNPILNFVASGIDLYNHSFPNNSRFGSGLGLIAGAFTSLNIFAHCNTRARVTGGIIAGWMIGGRLALTFTSLPIHFIVVSTLGALIVGYSCILRRKPMRAISEIRSSILPTEVDDIQKFSRVDFSTMNVKPKIKSV